MEEEVTTVEEPQEVAAPETTPAENVVVEKPESVPDQAEILKQISSIEKKVSGFQSKADKLEQENIVLRRERDETERARKALEATLKGLSSDYGEEPGFGEALEKHQVKSKLSAYEAEEETKRKAQQAQIESQRRLAELKEDITDLGVDPMDKRLLEVFDQAKTGRWTQDKLEKTMRKEALKIAKGEGGAGLKDDVLDGLKTEIENLKAKLGRQANEALPPAGGEQWSSDEQFLRDYSEGKSDDHARAKKLLKT